MCLSTETILNTCLWVRLKARQDTGKSCSCWSKPHSMADHLLFNLPTDLPALFTHAAYVTLWPAFNLAFIQVDRRGKPETMVCVRITKEHTVFTDCYSTIKLWLVALLYNFFSSLLLVLQGFQGDYLSVTFSQSVWGDEATEVTEGEAQAQLCSWRTSVSKNLNLQKSKI